MVRLTVAGVHQGSSRESRSQLSQFRSDRKAALLAAQLHQTIATETEISPLRHAQILRTLACYHSLAGDTSTAGLLIVECMQVTTEANLIHQRGELTREFLRV